MNIKRKMFNVPLKRTFFNTYYNDDDRKHNIHNPPTVSERKLTEIYHDICRGKMSQHNHYYLEYFDIASRLTGNTNPVVTLRSPLITRLLKTNEDFNKLMRFWGRGKGCVATSITLGWLLEKVLNIKGEYIELGNLFNNSFSGGTEGAHTCLIAKIRNKTFYIDPSNSLISDNPDDMPIDTTDPNNWSERPIEENTKYNLNGIRNYKFLWEWHDINYPPYNELRNTFYNEKMNLSFLQPYREK